MSGQGTGSGAFVLSLIGGVLILVGAALAWTWFISGGSWSSGFSGMMGGSGGMMGDGTGGIGGMMIGFQNTMGSFGVASGYMTGLSVIGLIAGIIVIIGAIMLTARPTEHIAWGTIILVFSIISFLGMGGFYIGAILGIAGGALALTLRPASKA